MAGFSVPQYQFSYNGTIAAGGYVNVYQTGTTTPINLYSNSALTIPQSNPVTLDVNGECSFYVGSSVNLRMDAYTPSGTFIESIDPVFVIPDLTSLSSLTSLSYGGLINKFRNPSMDIWQRATSGTITAGTPAYSADGWVIGSTGANVSWSQTAQNTNGCTYALTITGASSVTDCFVKQRIESLIAEQLLSGGNVTFQAEVYNNTGAVLTPALTVKHATAKDNWASTVTDVSAVSLSAIASGSIGQVAYTFTPSSSSGNGLEVTLDFGASLNGTGLSVAVFAFDIRATPGVVIGQNLTPPVPELRPIALELAFCQRYLPVFNATSSLGNFAIGQCSGTLNATLLFNYNTQTRVPVTGMSVSSAAHFGVTNASVSTITCNSLTLAGANNNSAAINIGVSSGLVAGNATLLQYQNAAGQLVFTGAEL